MKYKQLGRTGLFVSELCLGTMTLGGNADAGMWAAIGALGQEEANRLIARALAEGINFIDTADVYSFGQSERLVGQALKDLGVRRSEIVLATKTAGAMGPKPNDQGASRGHIMDSVQRSLERLQVDHIDLYQIHASDPVTPLEETLRALDDLTRQGLVRYVGVSNWRAGKIGKALGLSEALNATRFETLQAYYSIAGRDVERELVPLAIEERMGLLVWSPLAGGLLSGKFGPGAPTEEGSRRSHFDFPPVDLERAWPCVAEMRSIADARGVSVARIALAWLLARPYVTSVIIGAKRVEQLEDNLGAVDIVLTEEELARLEAVSALPAHYPGWMIERQESSRIPAAFSGGGAK
ncbi:aldo/keto reductase [bacterium M00.F.Ca.ET.228.01.1.1]|uniref:aldo/keto reductase n=1 Tax=Paraburkholderia phenoliruptrix TaxID=252970 RepID=UPI0010929CC1|nr:aldo/keto reductase [Paraburkholderia phenoliruptrix]TGP47887.1 aldo/keto reductase [bacterium M00.F.Ca.ET.228.01.1.1]TGS05680.1 aldo/keto reductase [bacterium M00.F.Ca.ET.191.01.1.1]TGU10616.1 aldo/keto reductase [bacterium M00.F.Ca.ET.155.01.1.1]MBW0445307.1 aldo/keto reductase [Paraburkholderia phenoliruptrix]MBW9096072.1 aldo/keto reductase [Paraburkholderia phenoliruptrix]